MNDSTRELIAGVILFVAPLVIRALLPADFPLDSSMDVIAWGVSTVFGVNSAKHIAKYRKREKNGH